MSLEEYRPYLGRVIEHGGKKWRVAAIRADRIDLPWAWLVRVDKPVEQCRLSLRSESFEGGNHP